MKKLLLGLSTLLAITTLTLYGACTADVEMGGNKIKGLGNGTADGDAVNYQQALKQTVISNFENNSSYIGSYDTGVHSLTLSKVGKTVCISGLLQNKSGAEIPATTTNNEIIASLPAGFTPIRAWTAIATHGLASHTDGISLMVHTTGTLQMVRRNPWPASHYIGVGGCWMVAN